MKKISVILGVTLAVVIGTGIFYACKKDENQELLSKQKNGYGEDGYYYKEFYMQGMREALIELKQQFVNNYYGGDHNSIEEDKTFEDFCDEQGFDRGSMSTPNKNLLRFVFQCVKNNYDDNFIRGNYTGKWIADLFVNENTWDDYRGLLPTSSDILNIIFSVRTVEETGGMEYFEDYCRVLTSYPAFVNGENPYDFVGQLHNNALDYIAASCNMTTLNGEAINNAVNDFMQNHFTNYNPSSYTKFMQHVEEADELTAELYTGITSLENILMECDADDAGNILDRLTQLFRDADASNVVISPNSFRNQVAVLESEVIGWNKHSNPEQTLEMNIYSATLATLSIAKYSYEYWYHAEMDLEHPWYPLTQAKKGDEPGFFKKLWNGICVAANAVWNALRTPVADAYGAWATLERYTYVENGKTKYGYRGDLIEFCHGGIDASAAVWADFP